jgi:hypothetical protein
MVARRNEMQLKFKLLGIIGIITIIIVTAGAIRYFWTTQKSEEDYTLLTFKDRINNAAWEGSAMERVPAYTPDEYKLCLFTLKDYKAISYKDNVLKKTSSPCDASGYPYHLFQFKMPLKNISTVFIKWEGFGEFCSWEEPISVALYVWNVAQANWSQIGNYTNRTGLQTITASFINNASDIIDDSRIFLLAYSENFGRGMSNSEIVTDYIELKITYI